MNALPIIGAAEQAGFTRFAAALRSTNHASTLAGAGPFTVFAPADAAFEKFSPQALDRLLNGDAALLNLVMGYHFAVGRVVAAQFAGKRIRAVMSAGGDVIIEGHSKLRVNAAHFIRADIEAANGVIHGVDTVLWPKAAALEMT